MGTGKKAKVRANLPKKFAFKRGVFLLGCRKWGFKRWGFKEIRGYLRKKAFSSVFWIFFRCSSAPSKKGRKRPISADFGRFAARHRLSPHLLHPHLRQPNFGIMGFWVGLVASKIGVSKQLGRKQPCRLLSVESATVLEWSLPY